MQQKAAKNPVIKTKKCKCRLWAISFIAGFLLHVCGYLSLTSLLRHAAGSERRFTGKFKTKVIYDLWDAKKYCF